MAISFYMLEGIWWDNREVPQVLPYFQALENDGNKIKLSYKTFRNAEDIAYWVSRIRKNERAFLYFACHGVEQNLIPADGRSPITNEELRDALGQAKPGAIEFLHFGCCEMIPDDQRKPTLKKYLKASQAKWVSGYSGDVDWLRTTLLDMALIAELAIPYHEDGKSKNPKLSIRGRNFIKDYEQLVRAIGFSGAYNNGVGKIEFFPPRHRNR